MPKLKANGVGSYRSEYWYYPSMKQYGVSSPFSKYTKHFIMLERLGNPELQGKNHKSCFSNNLKLNAPQDKYDYDFFGRIIILNQDVVMVANKTESLTFVPIAYRGKKLVLQCRELPDSRTVMNPQQCIVITAQLNENEDRKNQRWEYIPRGRNRLPEILIYED